ncbi:MAG: HAMP domain-containing histidine kinase [Actinomycetia bacterium]|nr:HAMP domain-containing histidine kinase [Actinomycetes bacterium]
MSLRTKLVLALVVCTSLAAGAVGYLSYRATELRLVGEIDASLETAVRALQVDLQRRGPDGVGRGLFGPRELDVQYVSPAGEVRSRPDNRPIPVSDADIEIAGEEQAGVGDFSEHTVDGEPLRVLTQSIGGARGAFQASRSLDETQNVLSALRSRILVVSLAVAAVSGIAGWVIARQVTRRLTAVTGAAEQVAATGALDVAVPVAGQDEAARLGTAFNEMMAALSQSRTDQQRLVQDAGHELRTPMTSLRTNLYTLRSFDSMDAERRGAVLGDIESETEELSGLIDEVVELATDRRGDEPLAEVDVVQVAHRSAERASQRWNREVTVEATTAGRIVGRPESLARAVRNLVENACKFDHSGLPIELMVQQVPPPESGGGPADPPWLEVVVLDRGPGIPAGDLAHVFERFYRSDSARAEPGSGLGLSIVAEIAAAHGGTCGAANRAGGGAAVSFRIPPEPPSDGV